MGIENMKMPQLGESVTEGTISKWLVSPGDTVNKYDPIAEVQTDKVNAEVPSSFTGTIKELIAEEGDTLEVGEIICSIEIEGGGTAPAEEAPKEEPKEEAKGSAPAKPKAPTRDSGNKARYSPAVLKLSQEHDIDLNQVEGTGNGGRITRKDLKKIIESGSIPKAGDAPAPKNEAQAPQQAPVKESAPVQPAKQQAPAANVPVVPGDIEIPVSGIRKAIASNMVRSKHEAPHAWTMMEVDVTNLVDYRNSLKTEFKQREGFNLTFFAFFVKAVAQALKEYPQINSMWAGDKIVQKKDINLSIAVATDDALYVPVIKNADEKTIKGIAREITELAGKVRSGKLTSQDMQGGTFTVNNTGSFGSVQSMGIINYPQAAILQVESIVKRPVVMNNGMIAVRDMVNLCMSLDHRVLDGLVCGRFLQRVKEILENTSKENTSVY
ncbi:MULTISPECIES: dihydrolipoamide acetyltransferase family protein [Rossellomorea]|uniref:Dihydrolipoamide acetyltransferase component of pyruvate dehydrogenase complex n=1 Tax=Rossellomorea vietnamensis TaxID=218284 RepID=A0A6I6UJF9_9BACI|nr:MULTISPECIES: dihydrolipoamide acetyltransferase family protein [Rossellomorea]OXS62876.1 branched-chain alpha-keto acid dehydrogenase subunit E2 [Bacillus sp. DSM 27956]PRX77708.1 2-oxoisovalerate dehydrogenase E2 component (dihydrolipoyl transacylase) [Bacillus sp. V-88]MCA0147684.1 2-oxo acid dehydrogenase subunit E2 [Rossellomorea vietnamensis]QHE62108.1 2-oxo acid dehydrogenase subunit E2 [Rossellomorea vietnamensis]UTE76269.1 2-oxo acid dehydrogenase subunit E2 [Rossellomorea sp. KS-H